MECRALCYPCGATYLLYGAVTDKNNTSSVYVCAPLGPIMSVPNPNPNPLRFASRATHMPALRSKNPLRDPPTRSSRGRRWNWMCFTYTLCCQRSWSNTRESLRFHLIINRTRFAASSSSRGEHARGGQGVAEDTGTERVLE